MSIGLELRDLFAIEQMKKSGPIDASDEHGRNILWRQFADECYEAADAFMAARAQGESFEYMIERAESMKDSRLGDVSNLCHLVLDYFGRNEE